MKDFLDYLKSTRWIVVLSAPLYFLFVQAYVYPTLSFDFSVASRFSTWIELLFMEAWLAMIFYFAFWSPPKNPEKRKVPAMINGQILEGIIKPNLAIFAGIDVDNLPVVNEIIMATPENYKAGMEDFYTNALTNLKPGVNVILIHLAFDDEEMNAVTAGHDSYHAIPNPKCG